MRIAGLILHGVIISEVLRLTAALPQHYDPFSLSFHALLADIVHSVYYEDHNARPVAAE